jgi:hypothetical protein
VLKLPPPRTHKTDEQASHLLKLRSQTILHHILLIACGATNGKILEPTAIFTSVLQWENGEPTINDPAKPKKTKKTDFRIFAVFARLYGVLKNLETQSHPPSHALTTKKVSKRFQLPCRRMHVTDDETSTSKYGDNSDYEDDNNDHDDYGSGRLRLDDDIDDLDDDMDEHGFIITTVPPKSKPLVGGLHAGTRRT